MTNCHDMRNFFLVIFFLVLSDKLQILKLARNRDKLCQTPNNENQIFSPLVQVRLHETSLKIVIWNSLFHKSNISYFFTNWKFHIFLLILYSIFFFRNQTFHMLSRIYSCCISPQYWQLGQSTKLPLVIIFLQWSSKWGQKIRVKIRNSVGITKRKIWKLFSEQHFMKKRLKRRGDQDHIKSCTQS